jgi:hypothetical protein
VVTGSSNTAVPFAERITSVTCGSISRWLPVEPERAAATPMDVPESIAYERKESLELP